MSEKQTDKILDIIFEEAAVMADESLGREIKRVDDDIKFSKEHIEKMNRLFKAEHRKLRIKKLSKLSKIAACLLLAVAVAGGISIFSVEAWRVKILNFLVDDNRPNTNINFNTDNDDIAISSIEEYSNEYISVKYIPNGFEINEEYISKTNTFVTFLNGDVYFNIDISDINGKVSLDTENAIVENIKINDYDGVYISKKEVNILLWSNGVRVTTITGNIGKDEIIKIAENIF